MHTYEDLKTMLRDVAAERQDDYDPRLLNRRALKMFSQRRPIYGRTHRLSRPVNLTCCSLRRVDNAMRRAGFDWANLDWADVQKWLADNWDKVIKLLVAILLMVIL